MIRAVVVDLDGLLGEPVAGGAPERGRRLVPGAGEALERLASRWPLAAVSSSGRSAVDDALGGGGLRDRFAVTVSGDEVARRAPAPDAHLEAARRLGRPAADCAAVEGTAGGARAAAAAGMRVVTVAQGPVALAVEAVEALDRSDRVDEEEKQSFPASDPHADWAGP